MNSLKIWHFILITIQIIIYCIIKCDKILNKYNLYIIYVYWCPTRFSYHDVRVIQQLARRVSLVDQELLALPKQLISPSGFSGVRVARSSMSCRSLFETAKCTFQNRFISVSATIWLYRGVSFIGAGNKYTCLMISKVLNNILVFVLLEWISQCDITSKVNRENYMTSKINLTRHLHLK